jgi:hypothetical protein
LLSRSNEAGARTRRPWLQALPCGVVAGLAAALLVQTSRFGLIGIDAYPLIAASRVGSLGDLAALLGEPLMHGYYPGEVLYRPLLQLTVALEHALWGTWAAGYQAANALAFAGAALALFVLARRAGGPAARFAPWVALAAFALHPLQYDVVPILARRSETMCLAFMALSLWIQLSPRSLARRFPVWPAVAGLAGMASKETAFVLPAVSFVAVAFYVPVAAGRWRARWARAAAACVPHAAAVAALLALRAAVLPAGGLVETLGGAFAGTGDGPAAWIDLQARARELLEASRIDDWLRIGLISSLGAGILLAALSRPRGGGGEAERTLVESLRGEVLAAAFVAAPLALTLARTNPWQLEYLFYIPMAGSALLTAALTERLLRAARAAGLGGKLGLAALLAFAVLPWVWQARWSPLFYHYGEGEAATAAARAFFVQARSRIDEAPDGSVVEGPLLPRRVPPRDPLRALGTTILLDYSVQAWADLTGPGRRVRVVFDPDPRPGEIAAGPGEVVLLLTRTQPGF